MQSPTVNWAGLKMIIVSSLVGLELSGFFSIYSYVSEDKFDKILLTYME
jgi:hypothetical protein